MNLPIEFCERMRKLIGDEYDAFIASYETQLNRGIRINTLKCDSVAEIFADCERVAWCPDGYYIKDGIVSGNHPYHAAGAVYFQEPSAMCVSVGLPLCDNAKILDLCAAPGGKTTHIGARMKNRGLLVANEIVQKRTAILSENVERMGLTNTIVTNETPTRLAEKFEGFFDGIIVDAPCSGEGMFRKEPQAVDEWSVNHTLSCAVRQKNILDDAYKMLRCGGYIMYSTCTFSYDENEAVVKYMIDKYNMELCRIDGLDELSSGIGEGMENCRRVFPHKNKGEGHFAALLRRTEENGRTTEFIKKSEKRKNSTLEDAKKLYYEFEKTSLRTHLDGEFVLFGDNLYLLPEYVDIDKLKVLRCGLHLGEVKRNRFEPSHALSHAFDKDVYINKVETLSDSDEIKKYMHGETITADVSGWCVIMCDQIAVGWGKGSNNTVKNHYPKHLRTL
ncbi:MAG: RsmB/NOP family class I SAM-dependent RNA methyltransferase [Clostridia bacterium]|nr:RsmB/NOP family class I SAM-dependent RNA methyltransferase [Clostridia bacterium]